ncbi:fluoride efflux transporter CrcB [Halovulum dunhuangense]|uniref:Fluoride-specific ion channel FluC n=1 Tax=Halovulum dunhuangense TaxID=1505036 RepID=A0A849L0K8_9RHOB|nr:CrcB family protein [Halovulum dunhuangense]NNU79806.1 fluoride efflux transporter CrcB [Halovulum dunhuangense]
MAVVLQVALGGALGASLRYLAVSQAARLMGPGFPWGTLAVNLAGCLLMGLIVGAIGARSALSPFLLTGLLGGFTTFSAFSLDVLGLMERGEMGLAAIYVAGSVAGSILFCFAGYALARAVLA